MTDFDKRILFEDNHLIVVNKNTSDIVQGDKTGDVTLLDQVKEYIKHKYNKPGNVFLGLVHRLDRPVSGAVIYARTSKALTRMNKLFQEKSIEKKYWAIVKNKPNVDSARLSHYLVRNSKQNKSYAYDKAKPEAKLAQMSYKLIGRSDNYFLLEVTLETGRHHQIRCQLAKIGSSIKGDLKYGFPRSNKNGGISLHARSIKFIHPIQQKEIKIIADTPNDNLWSSFIDV